MYSISISVLLGLVKNANIDQSLYVCVSLLYMLSLPVHLVLIILFLMPQCLYQILRERNVGHAKPQIRRITLTYQLHVIVVFEAKISKTQLSVKHVFSELPAYLVPFRMCSF